MIWELFTHWKIWDFVNNIYNFEIIIIHEVETKFLTLWWCLQLILDCGEPQKECIREDPISHSLCSRKA